MSKARVPSIANVLPNNWDTVLRFSRDVQKYISSLATSTTPLYISSLTLTGSTASKLLATNASKEVVSTDLNSWVAGTTNRITVADDGDGTITLSGPQDIHTGASPTFVGLDLTGLTDGYVSYVGVGSISDSILYTDGSYFGIGTESPAYVLQIIEDLAGSSAIQLQNICTTDTSAHAFVSLHTRESGGDPQIGFGIDGDSTGTSIGHSWHMGIDNSDDDDLKIAYGVIGAVPRMEFQRAGDICFPDPDTSIGVGTTNPNGVLHFHENSSGALYVHLTNDTTGQAVTDGYLIGMTSAEDCYLVNRENTNFYMSTNGNTFLYAVPAGHVGFGGETNPQEDVHANDTVRADTAFNLNGTDVITASLASLPNTYPQADNTYYLGKNDDDTPFAWKGVILKDQGGTGKYYRLEVVDDALVITDLTD